MSRLNNPFTWCAELIDHGYSVPQALRKVADMAQMEYGRAVARDLVAGEDIVNKFGNFPVLPDTLEELVIDQGGSWAIYAQPTFGTAPITHLWCTLDAAADRGVLVFAEGTTITGAEVIQSKLTDATDATVAVAWDTAMSNVNRMYVVDTAQATGDLRAGNSGKTSYWSQITAGKNQTLQALYTVPLGRTFDWENFYANCNNNSTKADYTCNFTPWQVDWANGYVPRNKSIQGTVSTANTHFLHPFANPNQIPELNTIFITGDTIADGGSPTFDVSAGFEGILWTP